MSINVIITAENQKYMNVTIDVILTAENQIYWRIEKRTVNAPCSS